MQDNPQKKNSTTFNPLFAMAGIQRMATSRSSALLLSNIRITVSERDINNIPRQGAIITVSNRPTGVIEEFILLQLLQRRRDDFIFLKNEFLQETESLPKKLFCKNSAHGIEHMLHDDACLALFPAGAISRFQTPQLSYTDSKWDKNLLAALHALDLPVIPVYLSFLDDNITRLLGMLHPALKVRRLITHLVENKQVPVRVRIGKPIVRSKTGIDNAQRFGRFLRAKLYSLGSALEVEQFYAPKQEQNIVDKINPEIIRQELDEIRDENCIGTQGDFEIYLAKAKKIPHTLNEIGRLREITFRNVGEGTLKSIDLDEFDLHYLHLFLWDKKREKIAGAYRIGAGDYIMKSIGKKGFYLRSLFTFDNALNDILEQSLELGRSFVADEYQKNRLPLFLLWKGIEHFIRNNPQLKYIIGPVSISSRYSKISRSLLVAYIKKYHWDETLAAHVKSKNPFKPDWQGLDVEPLLDIEQADINKFNKIIEEMEPANLKMPVLLKKYFSQNARIIAFNVDPDFNDSLDGFMISEISNMPKEVFGSASVPKE